ncbi:MAG: MBL fold metallo-hydrolase [Kofleriaceae bacterium]
MPIALNHPFGSVGYRITERASAQAWAYVSDTAPFTEVLHKQHFLHGLEELTDEDRAALTSMRAALIEALRGVDTVVYDTHFLPEEYARFPHYGHSTPDHALDVCTDAKVRRLVLYHHAPSHGDDQMDEIAARYAALGAERGVEVVTAREGMELTIGASSGRGKGPAGTTLPGIGKPGAATDDGAST